MDTFTWFDELHSFLHGCIHRVGWGLVHVGGDADHPPWTYTVGLVVGFAHPELVVVGLGPQPAEHVLNALASAVAGGHSIAPGDAIEVSGVEVRFVPVAPHHWTTDLFAQWVDYHGTVGLFPDPEALQVLWPDEAGCFPDESGFDPRLEMFQPLLDIP